MAAGWRDACTIQPTLPLSHPTPIPPPSLALPNDQTKLICGEHGLPALPPCFET
ncbi:hypothetical protein COCCADRAFT_90096 [Bipolaris zeicola 26-R-13]|uniref:Uncharacterized protein n=1 Tax=Cochliobolus carbonum (strain 26-R-13) TaxID=930089 RepID=W6YJB4_COCC2|nr:uncharacterized protein COCCADRAFT_90096 [Bipolaris zeicola 26-R-13]EUC35684.1 hypothetical protein COCCADRAFT_90096 [Bipolaris zeicola 26-R-13]